jgi:hypothetical protein
MLRVENLKSGLLRHQACVDPYVMWERIQNFAFRLEELIRFTYDNESMHGHWHGGGGSQASVPLPESLKKVKKRQNTTHIYQNYILSFKFLFLCSE